MTETAELLVALIRNACVNDGTPDSGHEARSVATVAEFLGARGEVVEPHPGRQSAVYRIPGSTPGAPTLALMGHLDVVPASPSSWRHDPFAGVIADGYVWGRGAVDMLNLTATMTSVFRRYLRRELPPLPGDLVLIAVADEEAGGRLGAQFLVENRPELVQTEYLLTEIASPSIGTRHGPTLPVTVAEKGPAWRRLRVGGTPGHGSQPYSTDNALVPLADAVARLAAAGTPVEITPEWRRFVAGLDLDEPDADRFLDPDQIDAAIDDLAVDDPGFARWVHACTHLTLTPTTLHAGVKANVVPDDAAGDVDIRLLPGQDAGTLDDLFRKVLGPDLYDRIEITPVMDFPPNASPDSGLLWDSIGDAAERLTGSRSMVPTIVPVTTDARFFRARGVVAYGVGLFDERIDFGDLLEMFHGNDERVSLESIRLTEELLAATVAQFGARSIE